MSGKKQAMVSVTQIRAANKRTKDQQATLLGQGLKRMHQTRELEDTPAVRGMIRKIQQLLRVNEQA